MVFICRRGMKRIRKQQSILPGDPERIVQNVRGLKDSEVYCSSTSRVAEYGVSSVFNIAGCFLISANASRGERRFSMKFSVRRAVLFQYFPGRGIWSVERGQDRGCFLMYAIASRGERRFSM